MNPCKKNVKGGITKGAGIQKFGYSRALPCNRLIYKTHKKRPNTIPVFGPGKWLLGESRALKVGINAG